MAYASWSVVFGEQPSAAKWNILGTNDASFNDGTGIDDGAITPVNLQSGTGSSWVWQSWTPTLTNITVGSGTLRAKYIQIGKTVHFRLTFIYGSGSSVGGAVSITLPVAPHAEYEAAAVNGDYIGLVRLTDNATAVYEGDARLRTGSTCDMVIQGASGTYVNQPAAIAGGVPMTWASGDRLYWAGTYEAV